MDRACSKCDAVRFAKETLHCCNGGQEHQRGAEDRSQWRRATTMTTWTTTAKSMADRSRGSSSHKGNSLSTTTLIVRPITLTGCGLRDDWGSSSWFITTSAPNPKGYSGFPGGGTVRRPAVACGVGLSSIFFGVPQRLPEDGDSREGGGFTKQWEGAPGRCTAEADICIVRRTTSTSRGYSWVTGRGKRGYDCAIKQMMVKQNGNGITENVDVRVGGDNNSAIELPRDGDGAVNLGQQEVDEMEDVIDDTNLDAPTANVDEEEAAENIVVGVQVRFDDL
uniref:DUF834 domain-containing protein n=1 Tax=Ascaris lumbricoides TaxID=6252 RepID=A0A0M3I4K2_ASCLU